jgi:hypothetical protein
MGGNVVDLSACYQSDPSIVARDIAGEMILVPIRNNVGDLESIYTLNETATFLWEHLDGDRTLKEIKQEMLEAFEVSDEVAEQDIVEFIEQLEAIGAVGVV